VTSNGIRDMPRSQIRLTTLDGLPEFQPGDNLAAAILMAARRGGIVWRDNTVVVVAQKIVSKVEGKIVELNAVEPGERAQEFARQFDKDPRLIELVLREAKRIVRMERGVIIAETRHGFVCANAGVDRSNVPGLDRATVLPDDPDGSARALRARLQTATGVRLAAIISDTWGRPWRLGLVDCAIGVAGLPALRDYRGLPDRQGRPLHATRLALADQLAAAAGMLMEKSAGRPVVLAEGVEFRPQDGSARELVRGEEENLFR
jgi:coenzyme F420-0:L-glutamate ligase/coenzyme F420-1:gamma-L-glutamate ligase